ncbi:MAG TPA: hypothetical protein VGK73_26800, partial [Polyangiaceae bacterium]
MTKRWNDQASDASELERSLLASAPDAEPPAGAEQQVWQSLAAVLAVPPAPAGAESAAQHAASGASAAKLSGASTLVTLGKGFALGVGVSLAVAGVVRLGGTDEREAPPSAAAVPTNGATAPARLAMNPALELPSAEAPSPVAAPAAVSRGVAPSPV